MKKYFTTIKIKNCKFSGIEMNNSLDQSFHVNSEKLLHRTVTKNAPPVIHFLPDHTIYKPIETAIIYLVMFFLLFPFVWRENIKK